MPTMSLRAATFAILAVVLAGCGSESPPHTIAGGAPGTRPAPTATVTPMPTTAPTETPKASASFRTPSGRLACATIDIDQGPPRTPAAWEELAKTEGGNGVSLPPTGSAYPNCSTDVKVTDPDPPTLAYGAT